jgi:Immune inhibitor A-like, MAM domain/Secretion system C-terminal sorting domain
VNSPDNFRSFGCILLFSYSIRFIDFAISVCSLYVPKDKANSARQGNVVQNEKGKTMKKALLLLFALCFATFAIASGVDKAAVKDALEAYETGYELSKAQNLLLTEYGNNGPVIDNAGGPDAFGYIWKDSEEVDGPVYNWIDITGTGTSAIADMSDDITSGPYPIGFGFSFYGANYTDFYVGSNGVVNFDGQYVSFSNQAYPTASYGASVAFFWNDLDPADATDADLLYETMMVGDQMALVISFLNWDEYPGNVDPALQESITAQMILFEDGTIQIHYQTLDEGISVSSHTIGIQDATGTIGLMALYNGDIIDYPYNGLAIEFSNNAVADASITGVVTDFDTEMPILGAEVNVGGTVVYTGEDGVYTVGDLFPTTVTVSAIAEGYFNYGPVDVDLVSGVNTHDFAMAMAPVQTFFTDFETGPEPFSTAGIAWEFGTPTIEPDAAFSGENAWSVYLDGDYQNSENEWLISGPIMVDSPAAFMTYQHWYNYESGWDGYNVNVSADGGATWSLMTPEGGYPDLTVSGLDGGPGFTGAFDAWEMVTVTFGEFVGQEIMVAFRHGTDSSVNTYSGVTVDDFALYGSSLVVVEGPADLTLFPLVTEIGPEGGDLIFDAQVMFNLINPNNANVWMEVSGPMGNVIQIANYEVDLEPGLNFWGNRTLTVPGWAPAGEYGLTAYLGLYPVFMVDMDSFGFFKGGEVADATGNWDASEWTIAGEEAEVVALPTSFEMDKAYPNPFNPSTSVMIALPQASDLTVAVFNVMGQQVATLANGKFNAGQHNFSFDAANMASGLYFIQAQVPGELNAIQKVTLMK